MPESHVPNTRRRLSMLQRSILETRPAGSYGYQSVRTLYNCTQRMGEVGDGGGRGSFGMRVSYQVLLVIHSSRNFIKPVD